MIVTHPKSIVSKEGSEKILLSCSAHDYGINKIQYKWEKLQSLDDSWIKPFKSHKQATSNRIIFEVITEDDEGVYRCVATNNDGSVVSDNATVTVYGKFIIEIV